MHTNARALGFRGEIILVTVFFLLQEANVLLGIHLNTWKYEPWHEISNNVVCATRKASDQAAHTRSLIRAFASRLNIL